MGWLALAMPSPVPRNSRITEARGLSYAEFCCLDDHRYYAPLRLPSRRPGLRGRLIPGPASAAIDLARGRGRPSPVDQPAVVACRLPYAGAVPGCSRSLGPDCCLRPKAPGSARSVPHGWFFRRGRVRVITTACNFATPRFDARISPDAGGSLPGSSGGLPGRDSHPLVDWPFTGHATFRTLFSTPPSDVRAAFEQVETSDG